MASRNLARARWWLFGVTLAAYAVALASPFQFDDQGAIVRQEALHSLGGVLASLGSGLRPLLKLSYGLSWALGGGATLPFHVFNLLVHLLNVELVMRLYAAASARGSRWPFQERAWGGVLAGALFALHPLQTEAVTYVTGRSASLSTCFCLLALLLYAEGTRGGGARYRLGWAWLAFLAALLVKETAASLPLALALWEVAIERSGPRQLLRRLAPWWGLVLLLAAGAVMHPRYFALLYDVLGQRSLLEALRYQLGGVAQLAAGLVLVRSPCIDPGLWLAPPSPLAVALTGAAALLALGVAARQSRARPLLLFGVGWFLLHLLLPYVFLPRADVINERHAYLANAGLFIALGSLAAELGQRSGASRWPRRAALALGIGLGLLTVRRNLEYGSEIALWRSTTRSAPDNPRAQNNLGVAYESAGRHADARIAYARALKLEPNYAAARENLLRSLGKPPVNDPLHPR